MEFRIVIKTLNQPDSLARIFSVLRYHGLLVKKASIEKICPVYLLINIEFENNTKAGKRDRVMKSLNKLVVVIEAS